VTLKKLAFSESLKRIFILIKAKRAISTSNMKPKKSENDRLLQSITCVKSVTNKGGGRWPVRNMFRLPLPFPQSKWRLHFICFLFIFCLEGALRCAVKEPARKAAKNVSPGDAVVSWFTYFTLQRYSEIVAVPFGRIKVSATSAPSEVDIWLSIWNKLINYVNSP
jgi:hypothetical protein